MATNSRLLGLDTAAHRLRHQEAEEHHKAYYLLVPTPSTDTSSSCSNNLMSLPSPLPWHRRTMHRSLNGSHHQELSRPPAPQTVI